MATRITVDPVTRIEGHMRIDCEIDDGIVTRAWVSGQMWRGIEEILRGRDARDAWIFTQRICGVCTTVHAIASVRAVENALGLAIPLNAQYIRNMIVAAHGVHDYLVHFYHLSALDWADIVSALDADPVETARQAEELTHCVTDSASYIRAQQDRLRGFVGSGQLGIFANGYWGHPEMKLSPELNLLLCVHYLQALDVQRRVNQIVSVLGGKTPHIQNLAVGGVANPINLDSPSTLTLERLMLIKDIIDEVQGFICGAYLSDIAVLAAHYPEWAEYGTGITDYLSVPDLPLDRGGTQFEMPGGYISRGDLSRFRPITGFSDRFFAEGVKESAKHAWYAGAGPLHPWEGTTVPEYTEFQEDGKYSWVKAPTFYDKPALVGPAASLLCMLAAGHGPAERYLQDLQTRVKGLTGSELPSRALHSTLGRHLSRAVRCAVLWEALGHQWHRLLENIAQGDTDTYVRPEFPKGEIRGVGFHEAPRGTLSHWAVIENGRIKNYQAVVPSTWNGAPRNENDEMGPYEASLVGSPVADPRRPLELLRTVHSFDPCMACAIHLTDPLKREIVRVRAM